MARNKPKKPGLLRSTLTSLRAVPPLQRSIVIVGVCVASVFELVGFAAIIPLFSVMSPDMDLEPGGRRALIHNALEKAFTTIGLPMNLVTLLLTIVLFMVVKAAVSIVVTRYVANVMARINTRARLDVIRTLMQARWSFYARQRLSRLVAAAGESSNAAGDAFQLGTEMLTAFLRIFIYLLICYVIAPAMVLVAAAVAAIMAISYGALVRQSKRAAKGQSRAMRHMKADLTDVFIGIKSIRAMGRQAQMSKLLAKDSRALDSSMKTRVLSAEYAEELQAPLIAICMVLGLLGGSQLLHLGGHELLLAAILLVRLVNTFGFVQRGSQRLTTAQVWLSSARSLVDAAAASQEQLTGSKIPDPAAGIRFEGVSFKHADGQELLSKVDFTVEAGKVTALIGASGVGKTTTLDLMLGLLPPRSGKLFLGGVDSSEVDVAKWRQLIGYVPQDVTLFHDSVRNNVALGETRFSDTEVWQALHAAGAGEFVKDLPNGLDHIVGERGQMISGGQRQRIALARALLNRPAILVLDEATAGLDRESEDAICTRIREMVRDEGLTVIAVSHGDAWRQMADRIYKISGGNVAAIEPGIPAEVVPISKANPAFSA
ncbi:ABC transporter ATP-binding protein [Dongia deserti]|uniref:ABC transporter ATP-binding protein n=1 Tax=Dongia deserti TaxID=2268030 RepID=UPI0013C42716|nr:ABC transporter ATP-binding protein [Dongia deserti]